MPLSWKIYLKNAFCQWENRSTRREKQKKIWNKVISTGKPFTSLSNEDSGWRTVENRDNIRDELFKTRSPYVEMSSGFLLEISLKKLGKFACIDRCRIKYLSVRSIKFRTLKQFSTLSELFQQISDSDAKMFQLIMTSILILYFLF